MSALIALPRILQHDALTLHSFGKLHKIHFEKSGANGWERRYRENSIKCVCDTKSYHTAVFLTDLEILQTKNVYQNCINYWESVLQNIFFRKYLQFKIHEPTSAYRKLFINAEIPPSRMGLQQSLSHVFPFIAPFVKSEVCKEESLFKEGFLNYFTKKDLVEIKESAEIPSEIKETVENHTYKTAVIMKILNTIASPEKKFKYILNAPEIAERNLCFKEHKMNLPGRLPKGMEESSPESETEMRKYQCPPPLAPPPKCAPPPKMPPLPPGKPREPGKKLERGKCPRTLFPHLNQ